MIKWLHKHENKLQWLLTIIGLGFGTKIMSMFYGSIVPPKPIWETTGLIAVMLTSFCMSRASNKRRDPVKEPVVDSNPLGLPEKSVGAKCRGFICTSFLTIGLFVILVRISEYHRPQEFFLLGPLFIGYFSFQWLLKKIPWMHD